MKLVENHPLDTAVLEKMFSDPEDLNLVWPVAHWPFDHGQWQQVLDPEKGAISFLVFEGETLIGHAALDRAENPATRMVRFLYIAPEHRSKGAGQRMIALLEEYARERLGAKRLELKVRSFNGRALRCYEKCGFAEFFREDTRVLMGKDI
jgi:RimJ/RimL family protein N-acetyltransferase